MRLPGEPPQLFVWGREGVPGEYKSYLWSLDRTVREERGKKIGIVETERFAKDGVIRRAEELLTELRGRKDWYFVKSKTLGHKAKLKNSVAAEIWMLLIYCCVTWKQLPPEALLSLMFEALDLKEGQYLPDLDRKLGASTVRDKLLFARAAGLLGEADAVGKKLTDPQLVQKLENKCTVKTLGRWRKMRKFKSSRAMARQSYEYWRAKNVIVPERS